MTPHEADDFNNDRDFDALGDVWGVRIYTDRLLFIPVGGTGNETSYMAHLRPERGAVDGFCLGTFTLNESAPLNLLYEIAMSRRYYLLELGNIVRQIEKKAENEEREELESVRNFRYDFFNSSRELMPLYEYVELHTLKIDDSDIRQVYNEKRREIERKFESERTNVGTTLETLRQRRYQDLTENERIKKEVLESDRQRKISELASARLSNFDYISFKERKDFYEANKEEIEKRFSHKNNVKTVAGELEDWKAFIIKSQSVASKFFFRPIGFYIPFRAFDTHAYIVGTTGSGKSELLKLIAHQVLSARTGELAEKSNVVVIDPHGDLAREIVKLNDAWDGDTPRFEYFSPSLFPNETPVIDVFFSAEGESESQLDTRVLYLADALDEIVADTSISAQMRALLKPCLAVLFRRRGSTLADLQRFMLDEKNGDLVEAGKHLANVGQASFFRDGFHAKQYDTTKRALYTRLQSLLNDAPFRRVTSSRHTTGACLNLEACLNGNKSIIFNLSKGDLSQEQTTAIGKLIIAQIKTLAFLRDPTPPPLRNNTLIIIDEAHNFVGESMVEILAELRKFGCWLVFANQFVGQEASTSAKDAFLANTGIKIAGLNSEKSLNILANEMEADKAEMKKLTQGRFMAKVKNPNKPTKPFIFRVDSTLASGRRSMSEKEFREKKQALRGIYADNKAIDNAWNQPNIEATGENVVGFPKNEIGGDKSDRIKPKFNL
jgi:hypothetical protein